MTAQSVNERHSSQSNLCPVALLPVRQLSPQRGKPTASMSVSKIETHGLTDEMCPVCNFVHGRYKVAKLYIYIYVF